MQCDVFVQLSGSNSTVAPQSQSKHLCRLNSSIIYREEDKIAIPTYEHENIIPRALKPKALNPETLKPAVPGHDTGVREALKVCFPLSWQLDTMLTLPLSLHCASYGLRLIGLDVRSSSVKASQKSPQNLPPLLL